MSSGTSRRFFIALGVARYENLPEELQLGKVNRDVEAVRNLFGGFHYVPVLEGLGAYESADHIRRRLSSWVTDVGLGEDDTVVLYFAGHAYAPDRDRHYLYCWDTKENSPAASALATEDLVRVLCEGSLRRLLLVLDTCTGGAGSADAARVALDTLAYRHNGTDVSTSLCFLSSARPKDLALDGAFAKALGEAVELATERAGQRQPYLDLASVVQHVNDHFDENGIGQRSTLAKGAGTGLDPFLPNTRHRADLPAEGTDLDFQHHAAAIADHYGPRSRGVEFESEQGRYFSGRERVLRELVTWMTAPEGDGRGRTVTGKPGCGKSAVLGRIVTVSDPDYRARLNLASAPEGTLVPENTVLAAVHARHKRLEEIVERVSAALGGRATTPSAAGLLQELAQRAQTADRPLLVVIDALDEAGSGTTADIQGRGEPRRIARELLRPMAEIPGVRLLVGTRRELVKALGSATSVLDLDEYPADTREDIRHYVEQMLLATDEENVRTPYQGKPELAARVARGVAERASEVFLVARLTARSLRRDATPIDVTRPGWERTLPSAVGEAFDDYLERFGEEEDRVRRILTPLAFAEGQGLPRGSSWVAMAVGLSGQECTEADVGDALRIASDYVAEVVEGQRSVYRLYHQALADHLRQSYAKDPDRAQERIVHTLLDTVPATADGQGRDWFAASVYVRDHMATHAADTEHLDGLVVDPVFLLAARQLPLLKVLGRTCGAEARAARTAYEQIAHRLSEDFPLQGRAADLQLSARRCGADLLAERIDKAGLPMSWRTKWAWWSTSGAHRQLVGHTEAVTCVATMVLDGHLVAVTSGGDETVRVWDLGTQSQLGEALELPVRSTCVALGELGEYSVALVGGIDGQLRVVDLSTNQLIGDPLVGHTNLIQDVAMATFQGRPYALTSSQDGTARLWDLAERQAVGHPLEAHRSSVRAAALAQVGDTLLAITGGADRKAYVWDVTPFLEDPSVEVQGEPFVGHTATVTALYLHGTSSGPVVLSGDDDGTLNRWDPLDRQQLGEPVSVHPHYMPYRAGVISIDVGSFGAKEVVLTHGYEDARVWDLVTMRQQGHPLSGHVNQLSGAALACHGRESYAVTVSSDRTARVWDLAAEQPETGHGDSIKAMDTVVHQGRSYAATGGAEGLLCLWDLDELRGVTRPLEGHSGAIQAVSLCSVAGELVVLTGGDDTTLRVWHPLRDRECTASITGHTNTVTCLRVVTLNGRTIVVSGSEDGTIRLWDPEVREEVTGPLKGQVGGVREMNAQVEAGVVHIAVLTTQGYLYLWKWSGAPGTEAECVAARSEELATLRARPIGVGFVRGVAAVLFTDSANSVRCFGLERWQQLGSTIEGWGERVTEAVVSPEGTEPLLAVVDRAETVRLWNLDTGESQGEPMPTGNGSDLVVSFAQTHGGLGLLTSKRKQARLWDALSTTPLGEAFSSVDYELLGVSVDEARGTVSTSGDDGVLRVHDMEDGHLTVPLLLSQFRGGRIRQVTDTRHLVQRWGRVELVDLVNRVVLGSLSEVDINPYAACAVHQLDGRTLAVGILRSSDLRLWDLVEQKGLGDPLSGHTAFVSSLSVAQLGSSHVLASASADGTVRVWDLRTRKSLTDPLRGDGAGMGAVDIGLVGKQSLIVAGDSDGVFFAWNPRDWSRVPLPIPSFDNAVRRMRIVRVAGHSLIVAADITGIVRIWNHSAREVTAEIGIGSLINDLAVTESGDLYAATDLGLVALRLDTSSLSGR